MSRDLNCFALAACEKRLQRSGLLEEGLAKSREMPRPLYNTSRISPPTERAGKEGLQRYSQSDVVAAWRMSLKYNFDTCDPEGGQRRRFKCFISNRERFHFPFKDLYIESWLDSYLAQYNVKNKKCLKN